MKPAIGRTHYQNTFCLLTPITAGTVSHSAAFDGANGYFDFAFLPSRLFISCDINDKSFHLTLPIENLIVSFTQNEI